MKSMQYYAPLDIRYEEVEVKEPKNGELLVRVETALTCGTDIKTYKRGHPVLIKKVPSGFGHEFAGVIEKIGKGVKGFQVGDRVVAANSAPCGQCFFCKRGEYNLCENLEFLNGAFAQYITIPSRIVEKNTIKLPENLSFERAAFAEPLANVVHGVERTHIEEGQTVGIIGIGPIGLMFARLAKLKGANVIVAGRNPIKMKLAHEFAYVDEVIDLVKYPNPEKIFLDLTPEKKGLDVAIECVGLPEIWERMFSLVRRGGKVHLFGGCKQGTKIEIETRRLHYDEIEVMSIFHHTPKYFREALRLISSGEVEVEKLITHRMSLSETKKAIEMHANSQAIKIALFP